MHKVSWTHHPKATDFHIIWGYFLFNSWDASWFSGSFQICMWNYLNHKRKKGMNHETSSFFLGGGIRSQKSRTDTYLVSKHLNQTQPNNYAVQPRGKFKLWRMPSTAIGIARRVWSHRSEQVWWLYLKTIIPGGRLHLFFLNEQPGQMIQLD